MKKWLAKALHNCIAHPLLMILPSKLSHPIHDKTAEWAFGKEEEMVELSRTEVLVLMERYDLPDDHPIHMWKKTNHVQTSRD